MKKEALKEEVNTTVAKLRDTTDSREALWLCSVNIAARNYSRYLAVYCGCTRYRSVHGFMNENLRELRKVLNEIEEKKIHLKQVKRVGTLGVTHLEHDIAVEKGLYYYQGNDFASEIIFSVRRLTEPSKEHVDNNFSPLNDIQKEDFSKMTESIITYLKRCAVMIETNDYHRLDDVIVESVSLTNQLTALKKVN